MTINWANPNEVPNAVKSGRYYQLLAQELETNPGRWAVWTERCDAARFYGFRDRYPQLEFRKKRIPSETRQPRYVVYARYVAG